MFYLFWFVVYLLIICLLLFVVYPVDCGNYFVDSVLLLQEVKCFEPCDYRLPEEGAFRSAESTHERPRQAWPQRDNVNKLLHRANDQNDTRKDFQFGSSQVKDTRPLLLTDMGEKARCGFSFSSSSSSPPWAASTGFGSSRDSTEMTSHTSEACK